MTFLANGFTFIKSNVGYQALANLFYKTDSATWTPVKTGWIKNSSGNWETIYPTPSGVPTSNISSLTFNPYQHHSDVPQYIGITNTGNYPLVINSVIVLDSTSNYHSSTINSQTTPATIPINGTFVSNISVLGQKVGTGFIGNVTFISYVGYLGYSNVTIPVTTNVLADFNGLAVTPSTTTLQYDVLDTPTQANFTITNTGNGDDLLINSITSQYGYVTISHVPSHVGYNFSTMTGNSASFTVTAANLNVGTYIDNIIISSNSSTSQATQTRGITVNVVKPQGTQAFTTPGTYTWQVPTSSTPGYPVTGNVHRISIAGWGGGGSGGTALSNSTALQGGAGGGGGSGAFLTDNDITVTPGETLTIVVGDSNQATTITGSFGTVTIPSGGSGGAAYDDGVAPYSSGGDGGGGGSGDSGGGDGGGGDGGGD